MPYSWGTFFLFTCGVFVASLIVPWFFKSILRWTVSLALAFMSMAAWGLYEFFLDRNFEPMIRLDLFILLPLVATVWISWIAITILTYLLLPREP